MGFASFYRQKETFGPQRLILCMDLSAGNVNTFGKMNA